jgi:hypothetical protein
MPQTQDYHQSTSEIKTLGYKERLNTWAIARQLPDEERVIVARFRSRSDADGHLQRLRQLTPSADFELVFDCHRDETLN